MGANYSNGHSHYEYGFPPRKRRALGTESDSNHFDKNYMIESAEFWSEKRGYRPECYYRTTKQTHHQRSSARECTENIYQKTPTEYFWSTPASYSSTMSTYSSSAGSTSLRKQKSDESANSRPAPPPLMARNSVQSLTGQRSANSANSAMNSPHIPPGIQPKYLPTFG